MSMNVERAVADRYSAASQAKESELCCPIEYDRQFLHALPQELIERDYGCGDPSRYVNPGETVLDLGSGGGKICYIASQIVGAQGRVIGVDMNDEMLELARHYQQQIGDRIGWHNVEFHKGRIQDLALDLDRFDESLRANPVDGIDGWVEAEARAARMRSEQPMVPDESVDVVISNCVLNLVRMDQRQLLFQELHRVLKRGGRAVISDIVCDEPVPLAMQQDSKLWSGCISGAFLEADFLKAFADAGLYGVEIVAYQTEPWAVIEGIEFRSMTVRAFKGKEGACRDHNQAVIYRGPWSAVQDDDGHTLHRGVRTAVCKKNYEIYSTAPYEGQLELIEPHQAVADDEAVDFDCRRNDVRSPRETKGQDFLPTIMPSGGCCGPEDDGCC